MRRLNGVAVALITALAFYFCLFWGSEALRMMTSSTWGLDEGGRVQFVYVIGALMGLAPLGLIKLAAFFAVLKLAIAVICGLHILDRFRSLIAGKAEVDVLEAGLILIVVISIVSVGPAVWAQNVELARDYTLQLLLAGLLAALCLIERRTEGRPGGEQVTTQRLRWLLPWR